MIRVYQGYKVYIPVLDEQINSNSLQLTASGFVAFNSLTSSHGYSYGKSHWTPRRNRRHSGSLSLPTSRSRIGGSGFRGDRVDLMQAISGQEECRPTPPREDPVSIAAAKGLELAAPYPAKSKNASTHLGHRLPLDCAPATSNIHGQVSAWATAIRAVARLNTFPQSLGHGRQMGVLARGELGYGVAPT